MTAQSKAPISKWQMFKIFMNRKFNTKNNGTLLFGSFDYMRAELEV
jgi:hypothetical protein